MGSSLSSKDHFNAHPNRVISVTSGKGGVGKSTIVANLAYELSQSSQKVLILDGDLGMANMDVMFGVRSKNNILDAIQGRCKLLDILVEVSENISLIPGGNGLADLLELTNLERLFLFDQINQLDLAFDYLIIDTAPGIDNNVLYLNSAAQEVIIVVTPEPSSITDAYALIKMLNIKHKINRFSIITNMTKSDDEGLRIYKRLSEVCDKFLFISLDYKGTIPFDLNLRQSTKQQQIISQTHPKSSSSMSFQQITSSMLGSSCIDKGNIQFFWQHLIGFV